MITYAQHQFKCEYASVDDWRNVAKTIVDGLVRPQWQVNQLHHERQVQVSRVFFWILANPAREGREYV